MARPDNGDWTSLRGNTRVNSGVQSTPIVKLGVNQDIIINDLNVTTSQDTKWDSIREDEVVGLYDSDKDTTIGEM